MNKYLQDIYFDPKHPASLAGVDKLYRWVKDEGRYPVTRKKIQEWLQSVETYSLHREVKRKFTRNRVEVEGIDIQWDSDLMDIQKYAPYNKPYGYVLVAIDIFSRYLWLQSLKISRVLRWPRLSEQYSRVVE
jgi:hypothetical protein